MGITANIRAGLFCADCVNCKLIVWQSEDNDALDNLIKRKGFMNKYGEDIFYLVRCGWTKDTVFQPADMINCEGKKCHD